MRQHGCGLHTTLYSYTGSFQTKHHPQDLAGLDGLSEHRVRGCPFRGNAPQPQLRYQPQTQQHGDHKTLQKSNIPLCLVLNPARETPCYPLRTHKTYNSPRSSGLTIEKKKGKNPMGIRYHANHTYPTPSPSQTSPAQAHDEK